jgi:hypothetical protein
MLSRAALINPAREVQPSQFARLAQTQAMWQFARHIGREDQGMAMQLHRTQLIRQIVGWDRPWQHGNPNASNALHKNGPPAG